MSLPEPWYECRLSSSRFVSPALFALESFTTFRFGARYVAELGDRAEVSSHQFPAESSKCRYVEGFRIHVDDIVTGFDV